VQSDLLPLSTQNLPVHSTTDPIRNSLLHDKVFLQGHQPRHFLSQRNFQIPKYPNQGDLLIRPYRVRFADCTLHPPDSVLSLPNAQTRNSFDPQYETQRNQRNPKKKLGVVLPLFFPILSRKHHLLHFSVSVRVLLSDLFSNHSTLLGTGLENKLHMGSSFNNVYIRGHL
jgi:hypothetical protein